MRPCLTLSYYNEKFIDSNSDVKITILLLSR